MPNKVITALTQIHRAAVAKDNAAVCPIVYNVLERLKTSLGCKVQHGG